MASGAKIARSKTDHPIEAMMGCCSGQAFAACVTLAAPSSSRSAATVDAIEPIRAKTRGGPRRRPHKLHVDKGYDYRHLRLALRKRRIIRRIARRGIEPKNHLGRYRWVVERTLS
jgi:hypothetical protein